MIKPKALKQGDLLALVAPSGCLSDSSTVHSAVKGIEELGFKVKVSGCCYKSYGYLAGHDNERANDINSVFADNDIKGIVCLKGGYGANRILDLLDYDVIKHNPKAFIGYSDITSLHIAFNKKCNLVTFHGPMGVSMAGEFDLYSKEYFYRALTQKEPLGELKNPSGIEAVSFVKGKTQGQILGGNLSLIASTIGTEYEINVKDKILFIEDIGEEPYRIDRMLIQLKHANKFNDCNGILIGNWKDCEPLNPVQSLTIEEVFKDIIVPFGKPVISNFYSGHMTPNITVPLGVEAILDADNLSVNIIESAYDF